MTAGAVPRYTLLQRRVAGVIAATLKISADLVQPNEPFEMIGMDSLAAVEACAALEDELGIQLPVTVMHEYSDLESLCAFIETGAHVDGCDAARAVDRMRADAVLPMEIMPSLVGIKKEAIRTRDARSVLLTGATGFVGAHVLKAIADETSVVIHCLVRPHTDNSVARLRANLERYDVWTPELAQRIRIVSGDLAVPLLGLSRDAFVRLAGDVDAIYHVGADVNWVRGYDALNPTNVLGTIEVLRLACTGRPKPVHFLSSVAVCHSTSGPRAANEQTNSLDGIDGLSLGYAQSKCVSEALVREAGARGLPVTILRSSLVTGDSVKGRSNADDLVSRFIAGCIALRAAPDLDWRMDCVPVDEIASSVVRLSRAHDSGLRVAHLAADRPRHWRECVLWMRLRGHDIDLVPYREWMEILRATNDASNPLHALRSFFLRTIPAENDLTFPELFEESRLARVSHAETRRQLSELDVVPRSLDARLLARYFDDLEQAGVIPRVSHVNNKPISRSRSSGGIAGFEKDPALAALLPALTASLAAQFGDESLRIESVALAPMETDDSIVAELTSWRSERTRTGLFHATLGVVGRTVGRDEVRVFVKSKPADESVIEVAEAVAALASPVLGEAVSRFRNHLGFTRGHVRELAVYAHSDPRLRRHMPRVLAVHRDDDAGEWIVALESIERGAMMNASDDTAWTDEAIDAAVVGLASIHAIGMERRSELSSAPWNAPRRDAQQRVAMGPFWSALAKHACEQSPSWSDATLRSVHERLVTGVGSWARALDVSPHTFIHNDFNPRNIAIRGAHGSLMLCAFDWELATVGVPQRDLAELLCFVLPVDAPQSEITKWIERHRTLLEAEARKSLRTDAWDVGFRAALCDLLVDRLASYAMVDRIRRQTFLPRVVRSWENIYQHFPWTA
ncbi:MAG TPA: thioester reductase domain-containing protein [Gemmatimonadaceae bacterium]|nr:thioester reductase domain-containing protein [Gemmatimonadaceae bacterium]